MPDPCRNFQSADMRNKPMPILKAITRDETPAAIAVLLSPNGGAHPRPAVKS